MRTVLLSPHPSDYSRIDPGLVGNIRHVVVVELSMAIELVVARKSVPVCPPGMKGSKINPFELPVVDPLHAASASLYTASNSRRPRVSSEAISFIRVPYSWLAFASICRAGVITATGSGCLSEGD